MRTSKNEFNDASCSVENAAEPFEYFSIYDFAKHALSGVARVVLQKSSTAGLLIVLALLLNSWASGLACLLGSAIATLTGMGLKIDRRIEASGILGLNGALTGVALVAFTGGNLAAASFPRMVLWLWIALAATACTVVVSGFATLLRSTKLPVLSFPFCAVTWVFLASLQQFTSVDASLHTNVTAAAPGGSGLFAVLDGTVNGFAQIFFQQGLLPGLLILFAIGLNSRISAVLGLSGCFLASAVGLLFGVPAATIASGAYGSNAALTAMVLGKLFVVLEAGGVGYALGGALLTAVACGAAMTVFQSLGLPALFLPFVAVTWLMVAAARGLHGVSVTSHVEVAAAESDQLLPPTERALLATVSEE